MKQKKNKNIKFLPIVRVFGSIATVLYALYIIICPWYLTTDARYTVANLQYTADRLEEIGVKTSVDTHGINRLKYPAPIALAKLVDLTTNWTYGYLGAIEVYEQSNDSVNSSRLAGLKANPYDTLSRLENNMVSKINQEGYEIIAYHEGITNPDTTYSSELLGEYNKKVKSLSASFTEDCKKYYQVYQDNVTVGFFILLVTVLFNTIITIFKAYKDKDIDED